jgi:hypothetical protein
MMMINLIWLIKMCLNEANDKIRVGNCLSDLFIYLLCIQHWITFLQNEIQK